MELSELYDHHRNWVCLIRRRWSRHGGTSKQQIRCTPTQCMGTGAVRWPALRRTSPDLLVQSGQDVWSFQVLPQRAEEWHPLPGSELGPWMCFSEMTSWT